MTGYASAQHSSGEAASGQEVGKGTTGRLGLEIRSVNSRFLDLSFRLGEELRHPTLLVGLTMERAALYEAIEARVDAMLAAGAREEVLRADAAGASETARKALGFEELLEGDVEAMKRRTRNYAKRQLTWMRKLAGVRTLDVTARDPASLALEILDSDTA